MITLHAVYAGWYALTQTLSALLAGFFYLFIGMGATFGVGPYAGFSWAGVFMAEYLFTFLLAYIVLTVSTIKENAHTKDMYGLAIGRSIRDGQMFSSAAPVLRCWNVSQFGASVEVLECFKVPH